MLALALTLLAARTLAADDAQARDLRCIAVISTAMADQAADEKSAVVPIVTYYIGRVSARDPALDLDRALTAVLADEAAFERGKAAEAKRCSAEMTRVSEELRRVGSALQGRAGGEGK